LVHLKKKRPEMVQQEWFFQWDNVPVQPPVWRSGSQTTASTASAPPLFTGHGSSGFLFVLEGEGEAGQPLPWRGQLKRTWEGSSKPSPPTSSPTPSGGGLSAMRSDSHRWWIHQKKLKNKFRFIYNHFCFIQKV
jgi:hypothetical protein